MPTFRHFTPADTATLTDFTTAFYTEDPSDEAITPEKVAKTIAHFTNYPEKGTYYIFEEAGQPVGFAIVAFFWSNEYGGDLVTLDEFYVVPAHRGAGIGEAFLRFMFEHYHTRAAAFELEVTPSNDRARSFYTRVGFQPAKNNTYLYKPA